VSDVYTDSTQLANLVQTAYDRYVEFALRATPLFRSCADKRPVQQAMPGSSVVFNLYNDLSAATSTLSEDSDVSAVGIPATSTVSVTLNEYGNASLTTMKLASFAFSDIDPAIANMIAYNQADSIDTVVQNVLRAGTNVIQKNAGAVTYNSGTTAGTTSTDTMSTQIARLAVAKLRAQKAVPTKGTLFTAYIHPEVSVDLRAESGSTAWLPPHQYSGADAIWAGEIGTYEGATWIETPRAYNATDGSSSTRVFRTYFMGQQALAEAVADEFHVVLGPVIDRLRRFQPIGWYGIAGWNVYRQAALIRAETTSSIHTT
jgi:N4-gp56 family major capsid protein